MTNETATTTIPYDMFNRFMDGITDAIPNISREKAEKLAISISNIAISSDDRKIEDRVEKEANRREFATSKDMLILDNKIDSVEQRLDTKIDLVRSDLRLEISQSSNKTIGILSGVIAVVMTAVVWILS